MTDSSPVEYVTGVPSTTVQGSSQTTFSSSTMTYFPGDLEKPVFLGASVGHDPFLMHCGCCGYEGPSYAKKKRGAINGLLAIMTLGVGALLPGLDTHHYCRQCGLHVAVAKLA